jgi:hypothetical protein
MHGVLALAGADGTEVTVSVDGYDCTIVLQQHVDAFGVSQIDTLPSVACHFLMADDSVAQTPGVYGAAVAENGLNETFRNSTLLHANFRMVSHGMLCDEVSTGSYGLHGGLRVSGVAMTNAIFMPIVKKLFIDIYQSITEISSQPQHVQLINNISIK